MITVAGAFERKSPPWGYSNDNPAPLIKTFKLAIG